MWELIQANKRKSTMLIIVMGILFILVGYIFGSFYNPESGGIIGIVIAIILWGILYLVTYSSGSKILLAVSGAKEVTKDVHPQLYNIVEEMKIASGNPHMPKVYIIDSAAPNAFATGIKPDNTAIAVTAGLIGKLNRDELQGVIAHEMSHIVNRDIQFMTVSGIMLGVIVLISQVFVRSLWFGGGGRYSKSSKDSGQAQLIFLVIAILAPIAAQLLYFAISRKREYLADASAVRFTRYPEGLAAALEKISNSTAELKTANKVTAPMYIANPLKKKGAKLQDLTSTHPPISERIRILRNIAHSADFSSYQQAFNEVKGKESTIIPAAELKESESLNIRDASGLPLAGLTRKQQKRDVGDLIMRVNDYSFINCPCNVRIKIPPDYKSNKVVCPRCGRKHSV
ncbi:M48 family metallopeptidase [Bacteroidota bacterium]